MSAQLALPGLDPAPDPLTAAREEYALLRAAWEAVSHLPESAERRRLQPLMFRAAILVDRLESGRQWWH